jgi:hypothetical protein
MIKKNIVKNILLSLSLLGWTLHADAGQLSMGFIYDGWNSNYLTPQTALPTNEGSEIWVPVALNLNLDKGFQVYGQGMFASGSYTYPPDQSGANTTLDLTNLTDTVVGGEIQFKSFGLSSLLNISLNLPTGDSTWEAKQIVAIIPTEFLDYRYRGRGFGVNALYGISFPAGKDSFGAGIGYLHSGPFDTMEGDSASELQLGDTLFLALNYVQPGKGGYKEVARLSCYYSLTTQIDGVDDFQLGTNLNASYGWVNPQGLSVETGAQYFFSSSRLEGNVLTTEPDNYYGPRLYLAPSYSFGDIKLSAQAKYVFANAYPDTFSSSGVAPLYFGGGWVLGVGPSWKLVLDDKSSLNFFGAYDYIVQNNANIDSTGTSLVNAVFNYWTLGTNYQIEL